MTPMEQQGITDKTGGKRRWHVIAIPWYVGFKKRLDMVLLVLFCTFVGLPLLAIMYFTLFALLPFLIVEFPIWFITGKKPVSYLIEKLNEVLP